MTFMALRKERRSAPSLPTNSQMKMFMLSPASWKNLIPTIAMSATLEPPGKRRKEFAEGEGP